MKYRLYTATAVMAAASIAIAGCGSTSPDNNASKASASDKVKLVFWQHSYAARDSVVKELAAKFQQKYPNVTIDMQFIPWDQYFSKLVTGLQSGTGPDVFQVPQSMSEQLINAKAIAPVPDSVLDTKTIEEQYVPGPIARWKNNGKYYGLPTDVESVLLFANADLLKKCGGDPSNLPKTWDELHSLAAKCTVRDTSGAITQAGLDTRYKWAIYTQAMYSTDGNTIYDSKQCKVNLNTPESQAAWKTATSFASGPTSADSPAFLTGQKKFENGKAVFYINHPVTIGTLKQFPAINYTVGQAPTADGQQKSLVDSWAYVVNAKAQKADWAWKWDYFLTDESAQRTWFTETGSLPAVTKLLTDPSLATDQKAKTVLASLDGSRQVETVTQKADDITDGTWDKIVTGGSAVDSALGSAKSDIDKLMAETLHCGS